MVEKTQHEEAFISLLVTGDRRKGLGKRRADAVAKAKKRTLSIRRKQAMMRNVAIQEVFETLTKNQKAAKAMLETLSGMGAVWNTRFVLALSKEGIHKNIYQEVKDRFAFTNIEFRKIFDSTWRSISDKDDSDLIEGLITERAIDLMALWDQGVAYFESSEAFLYWLNRESMYFNDRSPKSYLDTTSGIKLVREEIYRLYYSLTA